MTKVILSAALATLAFPSFALAAAPAPVADPHQSMPMPMSAKGGCCPEQKDGRKPDDCCKGMKCCNAMKPTAASPARADAPAGHVPAY